jgi:hypothetical protein
VSIQDERELRDRLSSLMDGLDPRPAPVALAVKQGKGIRMRRWVSAAAGLVVIAVGAALLPGLLRAQRVSPVAPLHYKVTVQPIGPRARPGLIGQGVTNGKHWQVIEPGSHKSPVVSTRGIDYASFAGAVGQVGQASPASLVSESASSGRTSYALIYGNVSRAVTSLVITLPDGELLNLTPVTRSGYRWVSVVIPDRVRIVRAIAYSGGRELAYAVPFGDTELTSWWRPGQVGPDRLTRSVGSGVVNGIRWRATAHIGPWGYCYTFANSLACMDTTTNPELVPRGQAISYIGCGRLGNSATSAPEAGLATAALDVRRVVLSFSDRSTASFAAIDVSGGRVFGYAIPAHLTVVRATAYSAAGHIVGTTSAAGWKC